MINRIDNDWYWGHTTVLIDNEGRGLLYISQRGDEPDRAVIHGVQVMSEHHHKGIGTELMNRAISIIEENNNITQIDLFVNKNDLWIVDWYKTFGFEITDGYDYPSKKYEYYMIKTEQMDMDIEMKNKEK